MIKSVIGFFKGKNAQSVQRSDFATVQEIEGEADNKIEQAIVACRQRVAADPDDVESRFALAELYRENADISKAIVEYKAAADISERELNWDDAIDIYTRLVGIEPDNLQWQRDLAFVLSEDEKWELAIDAYRKLESRDGNNPNVFYNLGRAYAEIRDYNSATNYLKKAINLDPSHLQALTYLGTVYQEIHQYEESLVYFRKAILIDPHFQYAYFNSTVSYIALGDVTGAMQCLDKCSSILHGEPINERLDAVIGSLPVSFMENVPAFRLLHDCEQFNYLAAVENTPVLREIAAAWTKTIEDMDLLAQEEKEDFIDLGVTLDGSVNPLVLKTINRPVYIHRSPALRYAINPDLDFEGIQDRFLASDLKAMTIDNVLTPEAWLSLQEFCKKNTFWYALRKGYLGAFSHDGFYSELLFQIAIELRERFPRIFEDNIWSNFWGFKHDRNHGGINVHADAAAVNVNFWLTPDHANLDPETGGLLVWDKHAPPDWSFQKLNDDTLAIERYLAENNSKPVRFPYRGNRALIFKSDLFHKTDDIHFDAGYENRRLNVTMLFGSRVKPGKKK